MYTNPYKDLKTNTCVSSFNPGWVKTNMGGNDAKKHL